MLRLALLILLSLVLTACAVSVREPSDGPPSERLDVSRIVEPEPRPEPLSPYGNHSPYEVFGKTYHVLPSAQGYVERGTASWYGTKFHGRPTSSGEPYDLYQLTAAHRTLPLPTWAEVRHLGNGRRIIVRINDRGPFHDDRIIDLSWAAAVKLGIEEAGTGPVEVRAIDFGEAGQRPVRPARTPVWLQVGAFSESERAELVGRRLRGAGIDQVHAEHARTPAGRVWRVRVGPLSNAEHAIELVERIVALGFGRPQYVYPD
ncbi:septal ring lytic transglycosylase RlpA family protein [Wenzhouxiangella marina]|uniref:Endolytic peptidoglycan transglycosylase RlpA n=1 Tax=Wenzhouxiangella marina TaxID=1579979 RepID=A0A0K0XSL8_9GAMM|nr:septal ring lytic transglycosylase RlpA family protein [Wenzhouxiangella marina]AKS40621.1 Rare lipoprotein A [Wenzhouxiangella marina]MBB6088389.1 rare lipoprotein A [Wenzhouxiangella marina]